MHPVDPTESVRIEQAVIFVARAWEQDPRNSKPTLFHSLRIAFALLDLGYPAAYAELAMLHDVLEDTAITHADLAYRFGQETADLVNALSHRHDIQNWEERYIDMFRRVVAAGRTAIIVKMIDLIDNSLYIDRVDDCVFQASLVKKMKVFLDLTEGYSTEPAWQCLYVRWTEECQRVTG